MENNQDPFVQSLRDQIRVRIGRTVYRIKTIAKRLEIEEFEVWQWDIEKIDRIFEQKIK